MRLDGKVMLYVWKKTGKPLTSFFGALGVVTQLSDESIATVNHWLQIIKD